MARIRSIHPGLFTDEAFMSASAHARLLIIGIWTEAWDDGVFEWKPLTLKARLFPVDTVNVADLLDELASLEFVKRFEAGKPYGVVRNFQKYQRPKKPNSSGVLPADLIEYAGLTHRGSEPVPNQSGTDGEKPPQMEDGGGREGEEGNEDTASAASSAPRAPAIDLIEAERRCSEAAGSDRLGPFAPVAELLHRQADLERDVLPVIRSRPAGPNGIKSWRYYAPIIAEAVQKRAPPAAAAGPPPVFVIEGSPEWQAWQTIEPTRLKAMQTNAGLGRYFPTKWPPQKELAA